MLMAACRICGLSDRSKSEYLNLLPPPHASSAGSSSSAPRFDRVRGLEALCGAGGAGGERQDE